MTDQLQKIKQIINNLYNSPSIEIKKPSLFERLGIFKKNQKTPNPINSSHFKILY